MAGRFMLPLRGLGGREDFGLSWGIWGDEGMAGLRVPWRSPRGWERLELALRSLKAWVEGVEGTSNPPERQKPWGFKPFLRPRGQDRDQSIPEVYMWGRVIPGELWKGKGVRASPEES